MTVNEKPSILQPPAQPISVTEASALVAGHAANVLANPPAEIAACELARASGRVLALPVRADRDQPPFDRALRDGFAVRAKDLLANLHLRVTGQLRAGQAWPSSRAALAEFEAVEIMTGAPLPPGADAVLMIEHVRFLQEAETNGQSAARILPQTGRTLSPGENVVRRGMEARQGEVLLQAGRRLRASEIALAAACGRASLDVFPQVRVAILATGDELVEQTTSRAEILPHQIYDSNSYALTALVQRAGGLPFRQNAAPDQKEALSASIQRGLAAAPLLLLTGGVSMGKYDLVEEVLDSLGAEFFFTGVKMQPGKPVVFGRLPASGERTARYFFGLPGNPVSAMVTFRVFVEPLLSSLAGEQNWQPDVALAKLGGNLRVKAGLTRFLPAFLETNGSDPTATPVRTQGSGDLAANARANCYVIVPEDCDGLEEGQTVRVLLT
ncbi:MAG TPA: gephyrin-like molybdotransferase Glp [Acidobacteriaceae bacterium]|nr:gephyrin-like molybdotransferase Glp [Acidobacteriaceae bacterium]